MEYLTAAIAAFAIVAIVALFYAQRKIREELSQHLDEIREKTNQQIQENLRISNEIVKSAHDLRITLKDELYTHFKDTLEKFDDVSLKITAALDDYGKNNREEIDKFVKVVEDKLLQISERVDGRLRQGFESVDKTFREIIAGIAKIAEAQRKIEELSGEVVSLQKILDDKKRRGVFGEVRLENILISVFGEKRELYDIQYPIQFGTKRVVVDAIVRSPQMGIIPIDSKFPLENYVRLIQAEEKDKKKYERDFVGDLRKHIDTISEKYIIKGVTAEMAILFLPAEAIFAYVNAYCGDVIDYARRKGVWISSPTTLMALLATIQVVVRDLKTKQQAKKIQEELAKLSRNFALYRQRWERLIKDIDKLHRDAEDVSITTKKISQEFEKIEKVEFEDNPNSLLK